MILLFLQHLERIQPNQMKTPQWIIEADFYKAEGGKQPKFWQKSVSYSAVWDIIFHMVCWSTIAASREKRCAISLEFPGLNIAVIKSGKMFSDNLLNKEFIREAFLSHKPQPQQQLKKVEEK